MKILYVSQYFPPEMGAPAARVSELARHWVEMGHEVTVLTGFPNHPTGVVPAEYRRHLRRLVLTEQCGGIEVVRTWLWPLPNRKTHERIRSYASFCCSAVLRGMLLARPDVMIATSPQLLVPLSGWCLSRAKRVPLVFEVRDLWPESLEAVSVSDGSSVLHRGLRMLAGFLYRRCEQIVAVTPAIKHHLVSHCRVPADKIAVIENGVETELFTCADVDADLRRELGLNGRFVVAYIGTFGNAHGLETLLAAAEAVGPRIADAQFLLVGEGAEKERILLQVRERRLNNIRILDQQPRGRVPALIRTADVCLVLLKKSQVFETVVPTKMLEFMACGRPVILTARGEAANLLEAAGAGVSIPPEDSAALARAIEALYRDPHRRSSLGKNGRAYMVRHLSRRQTASAYMALLQRVAARRG